MNKTVDSLQSGKLLTFYILRVTWLICLYMVNMQAHTYVHYYDSVNQFGVFTLLVLFSIWGIWSCRFVPADLLGNPNSCYVLENLLCSHTSGNVLKATQAFVLHFQIQHSSVGLEWGNLYHYSKSIQQLNEALSTTGMVNLRNHGVDPKLVSWILIWVWAWESFVH